MHLTLSSVKWNGSHFVATSMCYTRESITQWLWASINQAIRRLARKFALHQITNTWWRHQMETYSASLAICSGKSPLPGEFPAQRPVTQSFDFSLVCVRINGWVNNRETGDLRRHRAHYDVIVMMFIIRKREYWVTVDSQTGIWIQHFKTIYCFTYMFFNQNANEHRELI